MMTALVRALCSRIVQLRNLKRDYETNETNETNENNEPGRKADLRPGLFRLFRIPSLPSCFGNSVGTRFASPAIHRFACLTMIMVMSVQGVLSAPEFSGAAVKAFSAAAASYGQDAHFWWHSSGWAAMYERLRNEYLPNIGAQARPKGWDGKGAPRNSRPAPPAVETQQDRDRKIARVKIFPGDVELKTGEQVIFSAVAFDRDNNPVGGVDVKWEALHEEKNQPLSITSPGTFVSGVPGKFIVTAEVAGRKEHVKVTVTGEPRRPNIKSRSEESKSSRESGQIGSLRAPISGDQKRVARRGRRAGAVALAGLPEPLRAASAPMASRPAVLEPGEDVDGWNSGNNRTADDVGAERGDFPGRAVDGGVGSSNFQFAAPGVVMDGRGIDLSMLFHYNSRVWHKAGNEITHNIDREAIPGWSFGFGKIVMAGDNYMLIDGDGTRHSYEGILRRNFPAPFSSLQSFEANTTDGTFINYYAEGYQPRFDNSGGRNMVLAWAVLPNGTRIEYGAQANYAMYPTRITDAHGNFITITYLNNQGPNIQTLTDALGRVIYFYYDWQGLLTSIAVPNLQGGGYRAAVRLQYQWLTLSNAGANYGFVPWLTTRVRQNVIPVVRAIYYPGTNTGYWFGDGDSYSPYGMLCKVSERRNMTFDDAPWDQQGNIGAGVMSREKVYNYPLTGGSYADMPTYTQMTEDWVGRTTGAPPVTYFSVVDSVGQRTTTLTRPDGAQFQQITDIASGLLLETGLYRDGVALSRTKAFWEFGAYNSPRPTRTENWEVRNRVKATTFSYDPAYGSLYNSPTDVWTYGYNGELLRRTHAVYKNDINYNGSLQNSGTLWLRGPGLLYGGPIWVGSHIFNLVSESEVYDGSDVRLSRTEFQYDGLGLIDNPGMVQHNITYNPFAPPREVCEQVPDPNDPDCNGQCPPCTNPPCPELPPECDGYCPYVPYCYTVPQYDWRTGYRGNVTQIKRYADAATLDGGTAAVETKTYDIAGNLREQSTSCCEKTTVNYTTNTQYAWPETQNSGSPTDISKQNVTDMTYDYWTGLVMTSTNANRRTSQVVYDPNTLRPVYKYSPTGSYEYHFYDDQNLLVADILYEAGQSGPNFASRTDAYLDGLGGVVREVTYGKDYVWDVLDTKFDNLGRVSQQSRPYRYGSETPLWNTATYDSLDRPVQTTSPDGSVVTRAYDQSDPPGFSGQAGPSVLVTDSWGRERWARSDALGRLVEVAEPNPGGAGSLSGGAMYTTYSYDALDRIVQVSQGQQTRVFRYDSLGRLTHQKQAERGGTLNDNGQWIGSGQWSDVLFYDTRSNLTRRVDARGVQTNYDFNDPLNRLLSVQYDKSGVPANLSASIADAPNVNYAYMTSGDKTRAESVSVTNGMGSEQLSYDIEGRLAQVRQTFAGREGYPILNNYVWTSLDRLMETTYPQQYGAGEIRKKVEPAYDIASRIDSLKFGGVTYASNPVYNASSQSTSLDVGAQIKELFSFDPKTGLMTGQQVKRGADLLVDLKYNYTLNNDANNNGAKTGQLTGITDLKNTARNRAYEYDKLGRLTKVKGGANAFNNPAWQQNYSYDRFGNKGTISQAPNETVWVDDTLPAGAVPGADGGDGWNWISSSPSPLSGSVSHISNIADTAWSPPPYSGNVSHQSNISSGFHQHYFGASAASYPVRSGGKLYAYIYIDPANPTDEVMLQWWEPTQGWEHRAYWGANVLGFGTDGTQSRRYMGPQPAAGGWVRLEVPASAVGLEGLTVGAIAFTLSGGRANWDLAGVEGWTTVPDHQECVWNGWDYDCYWVYRDEYENYVIVDDSIPAGAAAYGDGGDGWYWTGARTPQPVHQHYFYGATNTLNVNAGDTLYTWAFIDSANPPEEIMLQWNDGSWEHRAYWGANRLGWGVDGTASRKYMGGLPATGGWVKLEVPASAVGLEGRTVNGMAFTLYGGRVAWDKSGRKGAPPAGPPNPVAGLDGFDNLAYNAVNNQIISPGFLYDSAGNQTRAVVNGSGSQQQYRYDCANRLVQVSDGSGNVLATHAYGAGNQRLMSVEGGVTKYFAWAMGQIVAEYEPWGTNALIWKMSYVYIGGGQLLATTSGADGTETRFYHPDNFGTRLVTAPDGTVVTEQFTMPFGNMQPFTSVYGGENPYQNPALPNPSKKRFTSYDRSDVTTLDYAKNRFYSPQQGRFTQVDPIEMDAATLINPQTLNLYAYCGNDPISKDDPEGLFFGFIIGAIAAIVGAITTAVKVIISVVIKVLAFAAKGLGYIGAKLGFIVRLNSPQLLTSLGADDDSVPWSPDWLRIAVFVGVLVGVGAVAIQAKHKTPNKPNKKRPKLKQRGEAKEGPADGEASSGSVSERIVIVSGGATTIITTGTFADGSEAAPSDPDDPVSFKKCVEDFLVGKFGSFLGKRVIPFFSLATVFDSISDAYSWALKGIASAGLRYGGAVGLPWGYGKLLEVTGKNMQAYPGLRAEGLKNIKLGKSLQAFGKGLGKTMGGVGMTLTILATAADVWARYKCWK
jgi:RHS repeat-associated protein